MSSDVKGDTYGQSGPTQADQQVPGHLLVLELDRDPAWTVIVLANDDPPTANRMARKVRRLIDAIQK